MHACKHLWLCSWQVGRDAFLQISAKCLSLVWHDVTMMSLEVVCGRAQYM